MANSVSEVFQLCARQTADPFWSGLFADAAKGKLPSHFSLKNGNLCFRHRQRNAEIPISMDSARAYETMTNFFRHWGCIYSAKDNDTGPAPMINLTWDFVKK